MRAGRVRTADMLVPHLKPTDMQAFIQKYEKCLRSTPNGGPVPIGILVTIDKKPIQYVLDDGSLRHTVADIPIHLHWFANQTFRHSNALLYDSARAASQKRIFSTSGPGSEMSRVGRGGRNDSHCLAHGSCCRLC